MAKISEILKEMKSDSNTVNSNKYIANSNTVDSNNTDNSKADFEQKLDDLLKEYGFDSRFKATLLAELLNDKDSIKYYEILIRENSFQELIELARYVKEMDGEGKIRTSRAIYFIGILRKKGFKTKFKKG